MSPQTKADEWRRRLEISHLCSKQARRRHSSAPSYFDSAGHSNSMVEAVNKQMKYGFLFRHQLLDFEDTQRFLETAVVEYNNRPHSALYGFTPQKVFNGAKPNKYFFKPQMEQAKILRKIENKALACDSCAFLSENQE